MSTSPSDDNALVFREVNGEILALDSRSSQIHQLNGTASFIWRACSQSTSVHDTAAAFAAAFHVDEETARSDVANTVQRLRLLNLVR
jgi:hypothetical protein